MVVLNQRDFRVAKARLAQSRAALRPETIVEDLLSGLSPDIASARRRALQAEADRLQQDIENYEKVQSAGGVSNELLPDELGLIPILARIARRLSQRELAEMCGVSEQQIQRYESDRYAGISLSRYKKILEILGVDLHSRLKAEWPNLVAYEASAHAIELDNALASEIRKGHWLPLPKGATKEDAAHIITTYVAESAELSRTRTLYRRHVRSDTVLNDSALAIWQARALRHAAVQRQRLRVKFNIVDTSWVPKLVALSAKSEGPSLVSDFLRARGIVFVVVPHLPHTLLDGAAMLLSDGTPVVAVTLRYDRLDSFWFTLLHEIAHVLLHFHEGLDEGFIDNLDIDSEGQEREADLFALSAFIPDGVWEAAPARFSQSPALVCNFAESLGIHPAIVAGRIRRERNDYKIFSDLLGNRLVRVMFKDQLT